MGDRLATIDMGRKVGGGMLCPLFGGQEKVGRRNNCMAQALTWNDPSYSLPKITLKGKRCVYIVLVIEG